MYRSVGTVTIEPLLPWKSFHVNLKSSRTVLGLESAPLAILPCPARVESQVGTSMSH